MENTLLPLPFEDFIPELLKRNINDDGQAFIDKIDSLLEEIAEEVLEMQYFKLPERCISSFLEELGYMLNAGIVNTDDDVTKRRKIITAIQTHKNRGTWEDDAKQRIDAITGYSAAVFKITDSDDSIEQSGLISEPDYYWSTEGSPGISDDNLGTWEVGLGTETVIAGNIYIDCHEGIYTAVLTSDQIEQIVFDLETDVAPAYMILYLGYINTSGQFIKYTGGIIS